MEWQAPAIVLDVRRHGENDAVATLLSEAEGRHRGLVRGGQGRRQVATWQVGNLVAARWTGRLDEQLGQFTAELVHPSAALVLDAALALALLAAACAVAEGALPEREAHPRVFAGLFRLLAGIAAPERAIVDLVRWEADLLADLGYGLDLRCCAVSGAVDDLAFVSPRTGRAVSRAAASPWAERLLPLPAFLRDAAAPAGASDWRDGLRLTGHFLARNGFGARHRPLPPARLSLYDRIATLAAPLDRPES
uniref:DNA repair protein RecO n=1 Tax=Acidicaldus sp. TaxID=1872105 RepID=A0A8J4M695_9PROT